MRKAIEFLKNSFMLILFIITILSMTYFYGINEHTREIQEQQEQAEIINK